MDFSSQRRKATPINQKTIGLTKEGKVSFEGKMKNGKQDGLWITFFPDGRPRWKGVKKEGLSHGTFHLCGIRMAKRKWKAVTKRVKNTVLSIMWHLNGTKWKEQHHLQGKPAGKWRTWNNLGQLLDEVDHEKKGQQ
jgi:antitoxin component YwqK of YwqJK toxin-antitoxin module